MTTTMRTRRSDLQGEPGWGTKWVHGHVHMRQVGKSAE
jgi:hypothetical protein